jgi:hypothetical protein
MHLCARRYAIVRDRHLYAATGVRTFDAIICVLRLWKGDREASVAAAWLWRADIEVKLAEDHS